MAKINIAKNATKTVQETTTVASGNSVFGNILWLFIAIVGIAIVYASNKDFFENRIWAYYDNYKEQKENLDEEDRKKERLGGDYVYAKAIADAFLKKAKSNDVLLIPTTAMFKANKIEFGKVPEPSVFYYYTGVKTVQQNCKLNCTAQWFVIAQNGGIGIEKIISKTQQDSIVKSWSSFAADQY